MSEPVTNHRHVHACRGKAYRGSVSELVRGDALAREGRALLGRRDHILLQFEANAGSLKRISISIHEEGFVFPVGLSFQQRLQQVDRLGPQWAVALFSSFTEQPNLERGFPTNGLRRKVQRLLNAGTGVVKNGEKC
jgi:hypothetical protein